MSDHELPIPDVSDTTSTLRTHLTREPTAVVTSGAVVAFGIAVQIVFLYAPEYIRVLGGGPLLIGLFGSIALLLAAGYPRLDTGFVGRIGTNYRNAGIAALATLGVLCWLLAPRLTVAGHATTYLWLLAGLVLLGAWTAFKGSLGVVRGPILSRGFSNDELSTDLSATSREIHSTHRFGLLVGFVIVALFLTLVPTFLVGFRVVLAVLVATGLCVVVVLAADTDADADENEGIDDGDTPDSADVSVASDMVHDGSNALDPARLVETLRSLPTESRRLLRGETLARFATGMVSVFVVIVITNHLEVDVTAFGLSLRPAAFFGVLVAIRAGVAAVVLSRTRWLHERIGDESLAASSLLVMALFPIVLVSAPARPLVVGVVFAFAGLSAVGLPARRALLSAHLGRSDGMATPVSLVSDVAIVPSAILGGVLYAVSPALAFGLATAIGLLGVREFLGFLRTP